MMKSMLLLPCVCSPPLLARLKQALMPDTSMAATMAMVLPTMVTMDTHMPTTTATTTMARGPLMPSPLPLLSPPLMLMLTTDTTDTHTDMASLDTMARGLLMPSLLLMLDT